MTLLNFAKLVDTAIQKKYKIISIKEKVEGLFTGVPSKYNTIAKITTSLEEVASSSGALEDAKKYTDQEIDGALVETKPLTGVVSTPIGLDPVKVTLKGEYLAPIKSVRSDTQLDFSSDFTIIVFIKPRTDSINSRLDIEYKSTDRKTKFVVTISHGLAMGSDTEFTRIERAYEVQGHRYFVQDTMVDAEPETLLGSGKLTKVAFVYTKANDKFKIYTNDKINTVPQNPIGDDAGDDNSLVGLSEFDRETIGFMNFEFNSSNDKFTVYKDVLSIRRAMTELELNLMTTPSTLTGNKFTQESKKVIEDYLVDNPVASGTTLEVKPRAISIGEGLTEERVNELIQANIATISNSQKINSIVYKWNMTKPAIQGLSVEPKLTTTSLTGGTPVGAAYAPKKGWVFVMSPFENLLSVHNESDMSEIIGNQSTSGNLLGGTPDDNSARYIAVSYDAKRAVITNGQRNYVRVLKLKDNNSEYELEASIAVDSIRDVALSGMGDILAVASHSGKAVLIYELLSTGTWSNTKVYTSTNYVDAVEISKDGLEIYMSTIGVGTIKVGKKVNGTWGALETAFTLPTGFSTANTSLPYRQIELSIDKQVIFVSDPRFESNDGRITAHYLDAQGVWIHKFTISAPVVGSNNSFGCGIALNNDGSSLFVTTMGDNTGRSYSISSTAATADNMNESFSENSLGWSTSDLATISGGSLNLSVTDSGDINDIGDPVYRLGFSKVSYDLGLGTYSITAKAKSASDNGLYVLLYDNEGMKVGSVELDNNNLEKTVTLTDVNIQVVYIGLMSYDAPESETLPADATGSLDSLSITRQ